MRGKDPPHTHTHPERERERERAQKQLLSLSLSYFLLLRRPFSNKETKQKKIVPSVGFEPLKINCLMSV
jgi:hypothetical protein